MILILARRFDDPSANRMVETIQAAGGEVLFVTLTSMEQLSSLAIANRPGGGYDCVLRIDGNVINLNQISAAWIWRNWHPLGVDDAYQHVYGKRDQWAFVDQEWRAFYRGFIMTLGYHGIFCVNPPPFNSAFEEKCCQLMLAAEVGLQIPSTLYTARLPLAQEFYQEHDGKIIYKPFKGFTRISQPESDGSVRVARLLTNRVAEEHLIERPNFVPTPGIFQPYIEKQLELRIVVVGKRIFSCAIHSQSSERSREDWRRYDFENTPYALYDLPKEISAKLLLLMERMNLVFGSIDMIVTPEGEHVFLEVNPNGQFDWLTHMLGLPIYQYLAQMLMQGTTDYQIDALDEVRHAV